MKYLQGVEGPENSKEWCGSLGATTPWLAGGGVLRGGVVTCPGQRGAGKGGHHQTTQGDCGPQ